MNTFNERLAYLFSRYYDNMATEEEKKELFFLLNTTDDKRLSELIEQAWETQSLDSRVFSPDKSKEILDKILFKHMQDDELSTSDKGVFYLWRRFAAAAAVIVFLSFGTYFITKKSDNSEPVAKTKSQHVNDLLPGGNKAVLTLGDGSTIILEDASNGVLAKQGNIVVNKTDDGQLIYTAQNTNSDIKSIEVNKISTPRGGQYQVVLPDGSKVWLNAASSISFPTVFTGKERKVEIQGEAYFEVAKNASMPFIVKTTKAEIEVLGTHFNVMAYEDEDAFETTLLEGSIKMKYEKSADILKPGEQAVLNDKGDVKILDNIDVSESVAWKNGLFEFNDASIETIMREVSRWYDVNVSYEETMPLRQFTGKISRNVKASVLFDMLQYTGVKFRIEGKNVVLIHEK